MIARAVVASTTSVNCERVRGEFTEADLQTCGKSDSIMSVKNERMRAGGGTSGAVALRT